MSEGAMWPFARQRQEACAARSSPAAPPVRPNGGNVFCMVQRMRMGRLPSRNIHPSQVRTRVCALRSGIVEHDASESYGARARCRKSVQEGRGKTEG